ncbi:thermonuclease family protein [Sphingopyxis sp. PAMC25046]|uniref:thermonuclease family protein n=1 Tax=Sphingopyxis sp. PAMC25046 TaxID=2565556 RepID=UPI0014476615|nr:thermonuclease family protein [Sphingopyxis sp. PAMC25046]
MTSKIPTCATRRTTRYALAAIILSFALPPAPSVAQDVSGPARVSDGDTLNLTGVVVRLYGIDAPELKQTCMRGDSRWACGREAAGKLAALVEGHTVRCEQRDIDDYGRTVAMCRVGRADLSAAIVDAGLAVALSKFTAAYVPNEARARERKLGLWGSEFQMPADYRAANPAARQPPARVSDDPRPATPPSASSAYFRNCKEAWAAGAAPIYRGQPGYRPEMDGDGDGIACEAYRPR